MSRRTAKPRAASGRAIATGAFGAFSSSSSGSKLSYLSEPPDLSSMSDANAVVSVKNLLKKDATTKAKALEDLISYALVHPHDQGGGTEDALLEAWVGLYPRIAIDNSRRVRELAHVLQLELMKSARKRMERHLPKVVATWLAGTFDRDKVVSRVASEGLSSFLPTPEKHVQFWRRCQPQILEYALDAIQETTDSLSDERSTSVEDAEAKYHRVLAGSLALVLNLLQKLDPADLDTYQEKYDLFFGVDKVWTSVLAGDRDPTVRRISCQLLMACIVKRPDTVKANIKRLSHVYIAEGLRSNHTDSATEYVSALRALTAKYPTVWTTDYEGKRSPTSRLRTLLERGSQGSTETYWDTLCELLAMLPSVILPESLERSIEFMKSMRVGITNNREARSNAVGAWSCYLSTARMLMGTLGQDGSATKFAQETIFPLTEKFLFPQADRSLWASGTQVPVLVKAYTSTATSGKTDMVQATRLEWARLRDEFKTHIEHSLVEGGKDYEKSQQGVADEAVRWFSLVGKILEGHEMTMGADRPIPDIPRQPTLELLSEALSLLKAGNWKASGVAAIASSAFRTCPLLFTKVTPVSSQVLTFMETVMSEGGETLLASPSASHIVSSINSLGDISEQSQAFGRIWAASVEAVLSRSDFPGALDALAKLVSSRSSASLARGHAGLQQELVSRTIRYASGAPGSGADLFIASMASDAFSDECGRRVGRELVAILTRRLGQDHTAVLRTLRFMAQSRADFLTADEESHVMLMTSLLSLSEQSSAEVDAVTVKSLVEQRSVGQANIVSIIQQNINDAGPDALSIDTLVQQALQSRRVLKAATDGTFTVESLLPDVDMWKQELSLSFGLTPDPSLSITSSLGGSYFLLATASEGPRRTLKRDRNGRSIAERMAMYTSRLLCSGFDISSTPISFQADLIICLCLAAEIATDKLAAKGPTDSSAAHWVADSAASDHGNYISMCRRGVNVVTEDASDWRLGSGSAQSRLVHGVFHKLLEEAKSTDAKGLYHASALSGLLQNVTEKHGFGSGAEDWLIKLDVLRTAPPGCLTAVAILAGIGEGLSIMKAVSTFCNRLISDVAGADPKSDRSLTTLVLLNAYRPVYEPGELPVASSRLVFAVKQLTTWLERPDDVDYRFAAEVCRSLRLLLPCIKDVYGSFWQQAVDFSIHLWTKRGQEPLHHRLSYIHASLGLMATLQSLPEPNDDLVDALQSTTEKRSRALLELLKLPRHRNTQALDIVDAIICRQVEKVPVEHVDDLSELYPLVASHSRAIQTAAFVVLDNALPAAQQQLSVDVLLDQKTARLPEELLSLLLGPPTLDAYTDEDLARFPTPIRSYLLSWKLVFESFAAASFKVRGDYVEHLKAGSYLGPLLDFTFDVLGHSASYSLSLDKAAFNSEHIRSYDVRLAESETEERNMQWLLIHMYYLVLKYTPGLFKAWFLNCRSKQTKIAVEGWMAKYFSPIIISDSLDEVAVWAEAQEAPADDEKELLVKVSKAAREVTAGYEVDEFRASIAIRIPSAFPLESVTVAGNNRVAVSEKKWQSWIMTTQGVITFSNGSIIDGLSTFRRNVVAALKGQTECAICYSLISSDKKMPDKRCQTCKNLFHRTCLYKWFQSSGQNTCPLCRNPIDYLGADSQSRRPADV